MPKSGRFESDMEGTGYGEDYIEELGEYDPTGVFSTVNEIKKK